MPVVIDPSAARQNAFNSLNAGLANAQQIQLQRQELYDARKQQAWENVNKMATDAGYRIEDYLKQPAGAKAAQQLFASYGVQMFETPEQQKGFLGNLAEGNIQGMLGALFPTKASRNEANNAGFRDLSHVYTDSRGLQQVREAQAATGDYTPVQEIVQIAPADDSQYQTLLASLQNGARGVPQGLVRPVAPESTPRAPAPASTSETARPNAIPSFTSSGNLGERVAVSGGGITPSARSVATVDTATAAADKARLEAARQEALKQITAEQAAQQPAYPAGATLGVQPGAGLGSGLPGVSPAATGRLATVPGTPSASAQATPMASNAAELEKLVEERTAQLLATDERFQARAGDYANSAGAQIVNSVSDQGIVSALNDVADFAGRNVVAKPYIAPGVTLLPDDGTSASDTIAEDSEGNTGAGGVAQTSTSIPAGAPDTWDLAAQKAYVQWLSDNAVALNFEPFAMPRTEEAIRRVAAQNPGDLTLGKYRAIQGRPIPGSQTSTAAQTSATSASTQTAQTPIDSPSKKLGWSPEDEQLVRDYLNNKPNANDQMNRRAEYLLTQARTQLTRDAVTEIRQSTNFSVGSDWTDPEVLKMTANHRMMTDLNGVFKDDPQMQHLFTNIAHLGIRERESALRIAEAELGLRKEQLDVLRTEAEASKAMAAIEMLKMESEAFRTLLDVTKEQFAPEIQMFQSRIDNAKDDAERGRIMQEARTEILRSPQFQNAYEAARKSAAAGAGLKMTAETFFDETFGWFKRSRTEEIGQGGAVVLDEDTNTGVSATEAASLSASLGL